MVAVLDSVPLSSCPCKVLKKIFLMATIVHNALILPGTESAFPRFILT